MENRPLDFKNEWNEYLNQIKPTLEEFLKSKSTLTIRIVNSTTKDQIEYKKDSSYVPNDLIILKDNEIQTKYISEDFINYILDNLDENIEELKVPGEFIKYTNKLSMFPKLRYIYITDNYGVTKKDVLNIKDKTNINTLEAYNFADLFNEYSENAIYYDGNYLEMKFLDKDLLITNKNKRFNSKIVSLFIPNIYNNLKDLTTYIKENEIQIPNIKYFNIISTTPNEDYITYLRSKNYLEYNGDISRLKDILQELEKIEIIPDTIIISVENKDYDYRIFKELKGLKANVELYYGDIETATIEEFVTMRETINYYKDLIRQSNLSPLEEITFAYDLMKSFDYKEGELASDSRSIHKCIKLGKIVCVGYSEFLNQLLSELGYRIDTLNANVIEENGKYSNLDANHVRNIIRIDDDKYNIHMVAALDTTWDGNLKKEEVHRKRLDWEAPLTSIDQVLSYIYFLIPKNEYTYVFNDKEIPSIFYYEPEAFAENYEYLPRIERPVQSVDQGRYHIQRLFDKEEKDLIATYINADRPPFEIFKEVINNVKKAEGYTIEESENLSNAIYLDRSDLYDIDTDERTQKKKH